MSLNVFNPSMPFGNIIDKDINSLCNLLWNIVTRIAITIMTCQHQYHDGEEDITISLSVQLLSPNMTYV